ncbi:MAG: YggS family pyridoxal phosphate-dependent enzyme [Dehalococcoidia bacterium]
MLIRTPDRRGSTTAERVEAVRLRIDGACRRSGRAPEEVTLVAVTKGSPPEAIREAAAAGLRHLGENRVQEAEAKRIALADLPPDIIWHMVGHLQTNKVKTALGLFDIIHSVDSLRLAIALSRRAPRPVPVFLEVNVAGESTKYGFSTEALPRAGQAIACLPNLDLRGLMTVAPLVADPEETRPVFRRLREMAHSLGLPELSMGMTGDFEVAIEEGATHVRIGRAIFGEREQA